MKDGKRSAAILVGAMEWCLIADWDMIFMARKNVIHAREAVVSGEPQRDDTFCIPAENSVDSTERDLEMPEQKIIGFGMTKEEKDKEDIEMLFGTPQERKKARRKEYYLAHREKELAASKLWRETNKERYIARNAAYREKNKEHLNAQAKEYRLWCREQKRDGKDAHSGAGS